MKKIYDSEHQCHRIYNWKKRGVISDDFKKLYEEHMSINNCQLCNIVFNKDIKNQNRCLDHDHKTGVYRQTICHRCNICFDRKKYKMYKNNTSGHKWITKNITRNKKNISVGFRYDRKGFKRRQFKTLTKCIAYSFLNIMRNPL
jgi:hypothetical protein